MEWTYQASISSFIAGTLDALSVSDLLLREREQQEKEQREREQQGKSGLNRI